jgi:hypothetical protein
MAVSRRFLALLLIAGCSRVPSRESALAALRAANPTLEATSVVDTVWADGPPWFSCAEVLSKLGGRADTAVIRAPLGNWRTLLLADWISLRDTMAKPVAEPGWCTATIRDSLVRLHGGWRGLQGDTLPSGGRRRGWSVLAGTHRIVVNDQPKAIGRDSAGVAWVLAVSPNENGKALGADRDSLRHRALLIRVDGRWIASEAAGP